MKLDPVFTVKENKLFTLADNQEVNTASLHKIEIKWSTVELAEEQYNEEFLAQLRDQLKALDNKCEFAVLVPVVDKELNTPEEIEAYINTFNHTARRVKDCVSVAGLELPLLLLEKGIDAIEQFIETLAKKHAQYVYFAKQENAAELCNKSLTDTVVLY